MPSMIPFSKRDLKKRIIVSSTLPSVTFIAACFAMFSKSPFDYLKSLPASLFQREETIIPLL
jgi:hypothetical protein